MHSKRNTTSTPLLQRRIQFRFFRISLQYFVLLIGFLAAVLIVPPAIEIWRGGASAVEGPAAALFLYLHARMWPALLVVLTLFVVHSMLFSHRIAGPLLRFRRIFQRIGDGDLSMEVRIRHGDYLHPEVEALNGMIDGVRGRLWRIQRASGKIDRVAMRCYAAAQTHPGLASDLAELQERVREIEAALDEFELGRAPVEHRDAPSQESRSA